MQASITVRENQPPIEVASAGELNRAIDAVEYEAKAAGKLTIVFVEVPNGNELLIVLGGDESVLQFTYAHRDPPYLVSRGENVEDRPLLTAYVCLEHHTEFPRKWVIPVESARAALDEFLVTCLPPTNIDWAEA